MPSVQIHVRGRDVIHGLQILALQVRLSPPALHIEGYTLTEVSVARSLFMWYMWRIVDVDVSAMQKT
jgi:hypothetical protein